MNSMRWRMLSASFCAILFFLGLAALLLNNNYKKTWNENLKHQLRGHVYTLLQAADYNEQGYLLLPKNISDPLLNRPLSGLYGIVQSNKADYIWHSGSLLGVDQNFTFKPLSEVGIMRFNEVKNFSAVDFSILWEANDNQSIHYQVTIYTDLTPRNNALKQFRQQLFLLLGGAGGILLIIQILVLFWGLNPLKQMQTEIQQIELAEQALLTKKYPQELQLLAETFNSLLKHADASLKRYRNSLGDLAHSLKTPVAILKGITVDENPQEIQKVLDETLPRIEEIMTYQLKRASLSGAGIGKKVIILELVERIKKVLNKVYLEKAVHCILNLDNQAVFLGDQSDLMEILGNLMDNAWKYGAGEVRISTETQQNRLCLIIENNGKQIPLDKIQNLIKRGIRLDEQQTGQGLGLALVKDIMASINGEINLSLSKLGSLKVLIKF